MEPRDRWAETSRARRLESEAGIKIQGETCQVEVQVSSERRIQDDEEIRGKALARSEGTFHCQAEVASENSFEDKADQTKMNGFISLMAATGAKRRPFIGGLLKGYS